MYNSVVDGLPSPPPNTPKVYPVYKKYSAEPPTPRKKSPSRHDIQYLNVPEYPRVSSSRPGRHPILSRDDFLWNEQAHPEVAGAPEKKRASLALLGKLGALCVALKLAPILIDLVFPEAAEKDTAAKAPTFVPNPALAGFTPSPPSPSASV